MRIGFLSEAQTEPGSTYYRRYWELVEEVKCADKMGFDFFGTSEQHFCGPLASVSAPEALYPALAMVTERIKLRHMIVMPFLPFNNPIRVAERLATLDILSNGRAEFGTGRANTLLQLDGFGCSLDETRDRWEEGTEIVCKALMNEEFEHEGKFMSIPRRSLTPRCVQYPHPPVFMVTQSEDSHKVAGTRGLGALSWDMYMGWDYFEKGYNIYREAIKDPNPLTGMINNSFSATILNAYIGEHEGEARDRAEIVFHDFVRGVIDELYPSLGKRSKSYAYTTLLDNIREQSHDIDWLLAETSCLAGDPDTWIKRFRRYEAMGCDEVIVRLDGYHHEVMKQLELIGKWVIPHFRSPIGIVAEATHVAAP